MSFVRQALYFLFNTSSSGITHVVVNVKDGSSAFKSLRKCCSEPRVHFLNQFEPIWKQVVQHIPLQKVCDLLQRFQIVDYSILFGDFWRCSVPEACTQRLSTFPHTSFKSDSTRFITLLSWWQMYAIHCSESGKSAVDTELPTIRGMFSAESVKNVKCFMRLWNEIP